MDDSRLPKHLIISGITFITLFYGLAVINLFVKNYGEWQYMGLEMLGEFIGVFGLIFVTWYSAKKNYYLANRINKKGNAAFFLGLLMPLATGLLLYWIYYKCYWGLRGFYYKKQKELFKF